MMMSAVDALLIHIYFVTPNPVLFNNLKSLETKKFRVAVMFSSEMYEDLHWHV